MSIELREDGVCWVQEFSLNEFVHSIQKMVLGGFVISPSNEHYPQGFSGNFHCGMVRPESIPTPPTPLTETSKETALKDDSSDVNGVGGTNVAETANVAKTAVKRTPTKKTT